MSLLVCVIESEVRNGLALATLLDYYLPREKVKKFELQFHKFVNLTTVAPHAGYLHIS